MIMFMPTADAGAQEVALHQKPLQGLPKASQYTMDNGIDIISYVDTWAGAKLAEIGNELMNNIHGIEMEYLDRIEVHPGLEPGGNQNVSASYRKEREEISIPVNLSGFLPKDYEVSLHLDKGVIHLYKGDEKETIEEMAADLSHEYGHHFSFFYFGDTFNSKDFKNSHYYKIRKLKDYRQVNGESSYEENIHRWSIFEIAAEDYKQLLGSPTGKKVTRFLDISQKVGSQTYQPANSASSLDYNAIPQENWVIPLAAQVDGLYEYFLSFLQDADEAIEAGSVVNEKHKYLDDINNIKADKLPVLSYREEEHHGFYKGMLEWEPLKPDTVEGADQVIYTLVAFTEEGQLIPIKTVYPGEETYAVIGTVTEVEEPYIYYYQDDLNRDTLRFKLYMQFANGQVISGEELIVNFTSR